MAKQELDIDYYRQDNARLLTVIDQILETSDSTLLVLQPITLGTTPAYLISTKPQGVTWPGHRRQEEGGIVWQGDDGTQVPYDTVVVSEAIGDMLRGHMEAAYPPEK